MNAKEYWSQRPRDGQYYKIVRPKLEQWRRDNHIHERCCVHHRDDNDEVRLYNSQHYELWGCNLDGTFEYGKYVVFMTTKEHASYHNAGEKNPRYGVVFSDETREKMRIAGQQKIFTETHKLNISIACKGELNGFYGKHHSEEQRKKWSEERSGERNPCYGTHHNEATKNHMSTKRSLYWQSVKDSYNKYCVENPDTNISIREFQKIYKTIIKND